MHQRYRLVREKVRDVCDRVEKVEVQERVQELVGSPKGLWNLRKRMYKIEEEFGRSCLWCPLSVSTAKSMT